MALYVFGLNAAARQSPDGGSCGWRHCEEYRGHRCKAVVENVSSRGAMIWNLIRLTWANGTLRFSCDSH